MNAAEIKVVGKPYDRKGHVRFDEGALETGLRRTLNGHETGNGGYRQGSSCGLLRQCSTLHNFEEKSIEVMCLRKDLFWACN